ncbi:hypothetical protein Lnau_2336 [Legionella nautarum]|uniref:Uncharacterized protein n=1 Tax=Legionella nautarum TaxID=45070 RepID=A0A0W0WMN7_9GAMM|nr:hypothetical protein [Legionella nautarum]KTD33585.1 hypothetical protein Lnau_2336 [Legionella nautarum]
MINLDFLIPAFDINRQGLVFYLMLDAQPTSHFRVNSSGSIAKSLERNFVRVIKIMSSLKRDWSCLETYEYNLRSLKENYNVQDARSADLSLSIAALNIVRNHNQQSTIDSFIGTGSLRVDGSFNETFLEEVKELAVFQENPFQRNFITAKRCNHLFDLEDLLNGR